VAQAGTLLVDANYSSATAIVEGSGSLGGIGIVASLGANKRHTQRGGGWVGGILTTAAASNNSEIPGGTFQVDIADNALSDELVIAIRQRSAWRTRL